MDERNPRPVERPREEQRAARAAKRDARRARAAARPRRSMAAGMARLTGFALIAVVAVAAAAISVVYLAPHQVGARLNDYKADGVVTTPGLAAPVTIRRDAQGTPYIFAEDLEGALFGQGFAVAQDRLFQMEIARRLAAGRMAEVLGRDFLPSDRMARAIGLRRLAVQRLRALDDASKSELAAFTDGVNAFIRERPEDAPAELRLLGQPSAAPWSPVDVMSIIYLQSWYFSTPMIDAELTAQGLLERFDGDERTAEAFFPFVENPDDPGSGEARDRRRAASRRPYVDLDLDLAAPLWGGERKARKLGLGASLESGAGGSNNWAFSGARMGRKAAIVANDPHLDVRFLPGPWHPVGLFTEDGVQAVGANVGLPGLFLGRNDKVAWGVTVGYADVIDLYVEEIDPDRPGFYREGRRWVAADRREEDIRVRGDGRLTRERFVYFVTPRGVILPDFGLVGRKNRALSLRWSIASAEMASRPFYQMGPLLRADSAPAAVGVLERFAEASLNFVVGDVEGAVAARSTGFPPDRARGDGLTPLPAAAAAKAWRGYVSGPDLPGEIAPERGWTGTANHFVAKAAYGRPYSDLVSPAYRFRRMKALFDGAAPLSPRLAAQAQRDVVNLLAAKLSPIFVKALEADPERRHETLEAARILAEWDWRDEATSPAPLVFQEILRETAARLYEPSLGAVLAEKMLSRREFWQERFARVLPTADGPIFEAAGVDGEIGRDVMIRQATVDAMLRLERLHGSDSRAWRWGDAMKVRFLGPTGPPPSGFEFAAGPTGYKLVEVSGSAETLDRAHPMFFRPDPGSPLEAVDSAASLRMVADLADDEKVVATLSGGVTGRTLHRHLDDQTALWASADGAGRWWFSKEKVLENTVSSLRLQPSP